MAGDALSQLEAAISGAGTTAAGSPLLGLGSSTNTHYGVPDGYSIPGTRNSPRGSTGPLSPNAADRNPGLGTLPSLPQYRTGTVPTLLRSLSEQDIAAMQRDLQAVGIIGPNTRVRLGDFSDPVTQKGFEELLGVANMMGVDFATAMRQLKTKPLGLYDEEGNFIGGGSGGGGRSRTTTSTSTSINLTDPTTARAILRQTLEERLGRAPKDDEFSGFLGALNSFERKNGRKTTTTTTTDADGNSTSSSVTSGSDINPSAAADEFSRQGKLGEEANTFMVASDYYNAALQAIQSPV